MAKEIKFQIHTIYFMSIKVSYFVKKDCYIKNVSHVRYFALLKVTKIQIIFCSPSLFN